jgi:uncharacterized protein
VIKTILHILFLTLFFNITPAQTSFYERLADSAVVLIHQKVQYDPSYFRLEYPNGDVPADKGVCTDVIIRAYRKLGVDLQKEVHLDMKSNFETYPRNWGLKQPDRNIDHRRVPNLMNFFARHGSILQRTRNPIDYQPGNIVTWSLGGGISHIGIVSSKKTHDGERPLIVHNIGAGQVLEDFLFSYPIIGHYKYEK